LSGTGFDGSLLFDDGETARTFEDVENIVFKVAYLLVKVFGYLSETMHMHAYFAQDSYSSFEVYKSIMKWKSVLRIQKVRTLSRYFPSLGAIVPSCHCYCVRFPFNKAFHPSLS